MKKFLPMLLVGAGLLGACTQPRPEAVDNPRTLFSNASNTLDVTRVEANDSATVLHLAANFRPGWWIRIADNSYIIANGDTLPLLAGEGIVPGAEHTMPESGTDTFALKFGPVNPNVESITFSEGPGGWTIAGIDLTGKPAGLPDVPSAMLRAADGAVFSEPVMEAADTKFKVHFMNYMPAMGDKVKLLVSGLGGKSFEDQLPLDADGSVEFTAPVYGTSNLLIQISGADTYAPAVVVAPGVETDIYIDPRYTTAASLRRQGDETTRRYVYDNGRYAAFNAAYNMLNDSYSIVYYGGDMEDAWKLSPTQYTERLLETRATKVQQIENLEADKQLKDFLLANLDNDVLSAMAMAPSIMGNSFFMAHPRFDGNWRDSIAGFPGDAEYRMVAEKIDAANPRLLAIRNYAAALDIDWTKYGAGNQVAEARKYLSACEKASQGELAQADIAELEALSLPFYAAAAADRQKVAIEKLNSLEAMIQPVPEVADAELFNAIIAPHKGKVVLVDLWNTWCGPCRRALAANEPLKTGELANDDIVWIYIADTSSEPGTYASMLPGIKGLHYRVNENQIKAIREQFKVDGIPFYILVDRQGNATGHPDFRDHSKLVEGIKGAL